MTVADRAIESVEVQPRITEGGILIGYWDEADLADARTRLKPRFASHNPLVRETLRPARRRWSPPPMRAEVPGVTPARSGLDAVV